MELQLAGVRVSAAVRGVTDARHIAVSGAPFLGLLGTVWGVMSTFSYVAMKGSAPAHTEQMGGRLPDAIVYPTGGGTGLVGMWKGFAEMEELGWIGA